MQKYICDRPSCLHVFDADEYDHIIEAHGEELAVCPVCGYDDTSEAQQCRECEAWVHETDGGLCPRCAGDTVRELMIVLRRTFTTAQYEFLSDIGVVPA
jgi:RNA polymerase subunit RPABC4/transcription elongation factor Spt4